jgi:hypothetical protein
VLSLSFKSFLKMNIFLRNSRVITLFYYLQTFTVHSLEILAGDGCNYISIIPNVILHGFPKSEWRFYSASDFWIHLIRWIW